MVKDRLPDLRLAQRSRSCSSDEEVCFSYDKKTNEIAQFLHKVERIRNGIDSIDANRDEIKKLNSIILSLPRGKGACNSEVENRKMAISRAMNQVQYDTKGIEKLIEKDKGMPIDALSTLARIQRIQYSTLVWMFADAVKNYNEMLLNHQARCKAIVHQQLQIIDRAATDEELETLLQGDTGAALFVDNIVADTLEAKLALANVRARHEDLLAVESSVKEVRDMFVQMATLLEAQGDNVKRVEFHVVKAGGCTDLGNTKLQKAKRLKKKQRKMKCILIVGLGILLAIILILLVI